MSSSRPSGSSAIVRYVGGAVALVVAMALVFWGIGMAADDGDTTAAPTVDDEPAQGADTADDVGDGATSPDDTGDAPDDDGSPDQGTSPDVEATPDEPSPSPTGPTTEPSAEPSPEPSPTATSEPTPEDGDRIDPSSISVQVLDAVLDDGGAKAEEVAARLRADGYRVVAVNKASRRYENTTAMFTPGYRPQAEQIADEYDFPAVQEQPGNLSEQVQVHVVVGANP